VDSNPHAETPGRGLLHSSG